MGESREPQPSETSAERLSRALVVMKQWPDTDETAHVFLARHPDIRAELEPMLLGTGPDASTLAGENLLDNRFRILRLIGRGGMGSVYEAFDGKLRRRVAIKLLRVVLQFEDLARERFRREAELMARMQHPNIVAVHEVGEIDGSPFLVMDLVDGVPLSRLLASLAGTRAADITQLTQTLGTLLEGKTGDSGKSMASQHRALAADYEHQMVDWVIDIARALDYAHHQGLVHRDVKPSNILITRDGRALLTDFGLAREQGQRGLTVTGEFAGTPDYASPEHFGGSMDLDARSDVFSLGATLYELLTHQRPFHASSEIEVRERVVRHEPQSVSARNARVSRDLAAVVGRALEKSPARRYQDAAAFAADLDRWRNGFPVQARPVTVTRRLQRWVARNRVASAFLALLLASTVSVSWLAWRTQQLLISRDIDATAAEVERVWESASRLVVARGDRVHALKALLAQARNLCARHGELRVRLADMRRGGTRTALTAGEHTRLRSELSEERERKSELACYSGNYLTGRIRDFLDREISDATGRIEDLDRALVDTRGWRVDRQEQHDRLADLVWSLEELTQRQVPRLERYLEWASTSDEVSLRRYASAWDAALAALATDARFAGVKVGRQTGLVPLGSDPRSTLLEFWVLGSGEEPQRDAASGQLGMQPESGIVLVLLPPQRGSGAGEAIALEPFFCAKFEVSVRQMQNMVDRLPLRSDGTPAWSARFPTYTTSPVVDVSWDQCKGVLDMFDLELPTREQWLWACRGEDDVEWWTQGFPEPTDEDRTLAIERLRAVANFYDPRYPSPSVWPIDGAPVDRPVNRTFALAQANRWGLVHMHGNVKEWLADSPHVVVQGSDLPAVMVRARLLAGGSVEDSPGDNGHRTGCRLFDHSDRPVRSSHVGLRPVRPVERSVP